MKQSVSLTTTLKNFQTIPVWFDTSGPLNNVVISTRIRLARNLSKRHFPNRANPAERGRVFKEISEAIQKSSTLSHLEIYNLHGMDKILQQYFVEERMISPDMLRSDGDRGVACDKNRHVNIMINEEDHIRFQCLSSGFLPHETWQTINKIDDEIGQKVVYAFDERKGFLTSCPTNSGTGLRVSFLMHLPGLVLTKAIDPVLLGASQMGISTRGFFGEHSEVVGNFFQMSNQATMGAHEKEFLESTIKTISEVNKHELAAREKLMEDALLQLEDKVYRAYGLLQFARTLSISEFLNLSSAIRLGIELKIFNELTIDELNRITMIIMPAHLQLYKNTFFENESEISVSRASTVKELLLNRESIFEPITTKLIKKRKSSATHKKEQ